MTERSPDRTGSSLSDWTTYKVETLTPDQGWAMMCRAGDTLSQAAQTLAGYRQSWPAQRHRLVKMNLARTGWEPLTDTETQASEADVLLWLDTWLDEAREQNDA